jgi:hypothetical protein
MLEGNRKSIFVSASVDQDLQCTEAYVVDDKIDPDDENVDQGNGKSIFVSTSVDKDLQCTEAYVVDDEIDPDDENVDDPPSELPSLFI